jgi:hypothetical protein
MGAESNQGSAPFLLPETSMTEEEKAANPFLAVALDIKAINSSMIQMRGEFENFRKEQITEDRLKVIILESLEKHQEKCPAVTGADRVWAAIDSLKAYVNKALGAWTLLVTVLGLLIAWWAGRK